MHLFTKRNKNVEKALSSVYWNGKKDIPPWGKKREGY
jgi:hypothetical protein